MQISQTHDIYSRMDKTVEKIQESQHVKNQFLWGLGKGLSDSPNLNQS